MLKSVKYTAKTYKFSKDDSAASVVVLRVDSDKASFSNSNSQIGLVNRVTEVLADDMSTVVHKLYCIVNGNNKSFITVNSKLAEGISAGDLIRYNLDPNTKQIIALERTVIL